MIKFIFISLILLPNFLHGWGGHGKMYKERNQYHVICRLTKEKIVEPFFGEDATKCFYTCSDKEKMVITTHSDHFCEKQIISPRGDVRDWRTK